MGQGCRARLCAIAPDRPGPHRADGRLAVPLAAVADAAGTGCPRGRPVGPQTAAAAPPEGLRARHGATLKRQRAPPGALSRDPVGFCLLRRGRRNGGTLGGRRRAVELLAQLLGAIVENLLERVLAGRFLAEFVEGQGGVAVVD